MRRTCHEKKPRLSPDQKRELAIKVRQGPEDRGLDTAVSTSPIIADMVKRRFGISCSLSQIRRVLHKSGFSRQYPGKNSPKPMRNSRPHGLKRNCLRLKKVRRDNGILMYQDELSFREAGSIFRHWAMEGTGCVVKTSFTRKSLKVMGAVTVGNHPKFHSRFVNGFNIKSFLIFLDQLISRHNNQKIHLSRTTLNITRAPK